MCSLGHNFDMYLYWYKFYIQLGMPHKGWYQIANMNP